VFAGSGSIISFIFTSNKGRKEYIYCIFNGHARAPSTPILLVCLFRLGTSPFLGNIQPHECGISLVFVASPLSTHH